MSRARPPRFQTSADAPDCGIHPAAFATERPLIIELTERRTNARWCERTLVRKRGRRCVSQQPVVWQVGFSMCRRAKARLTHPTVVSSANRLLLPQFHKITRQTFSSAAHTPLAECVSPPAVTAANSPTATSACAIRQRGLPRRRCPLREKYRRTTPACSPPFAVG
jgi:hypothetical protein